MSDDMNTQEHREGLGKKRSLIQKGRKAVEKKAQQLGKLEVQYVPILSVSPNAYNPNRQSEHDFELLLRSMEEDGFTQPIIVQRGTRTIVDGEHRWRAAQALGFEEIPVVFVDMTPEQMRIATLRHNRARGSEDMELTAQLLRDLQQLGALDWAADSLMLDDVELQKLIEDTSAPELLAADEFSEAWVPAKAQDAGGVETRVATQSAQPTAGFTVQGEDKHLHAMSERAVLDIRAREEAIRLAKSEEEKEMARKAADVFRLTLMLSGEEAKLVKVMLGSTPAVALVKLCEFAQAHGFKAE